MSNAWNQTHRIKILVVGPSMTPNIVSGVIKGSITISRCRI
ncbi:hypothetical protein Gotur_026866 [Gossypium turneri]